MEIRIKHKGYTAILYGTSSMSIYDKHKKEVMHTGYRNCHTAKQVREVIDGFIKYGILPAM